MHEKNTDKKNIVAQSNLPKSFLYLKACGAEMIVLVAMGNYNCFP